MDQSDKIHRLRWLHVSDFHCGADAYGQKQALEWVLQKIKRKVDSGWRADLIFITGDLANRGARGEFEAYADWFHFPLLEILGQDWQGRIYSIPGNHDVDQTQARIVDLYTVRNRAPELFDPTPDGLSLREPILARFRNFIELDFTGQADWLKSPEGCYADSFAFGDLNIGVLGINTAWLCAGEGDRNQLTAGSNIVELGLRKLDRCDVRFVLGHHPVDWFADDEEHKIRSRFSSRHVIYLHGHLHKGIGTKDLDGPFLVLQAGACFQAREDDAWLNRFLFGELDPELQQVLIEPLRWSGELREWVADTGAYPERFQAENPTIFRFPIPGATTPAPAQSGASGSKARPTPLTMDGWLNIDLAFIAARRTTLPAERILRFFDGAAPSWEQVCSGQAPKRQLVKSLQDALMASSSSRSSAFLLQGAGGEGKSTILGQVAVAMAEAGWKVLFNIRPNFEPDLDAVRDLTARSEPLLLVCDDAAYAAPQLYALLSGWQKSETPLRLLMATRRSDWHIKQGDQLRWSDCADLKITDLRGIELEDAKEIVRAWSEYGDAGMANLRSIPLERAAAELVKAAREEKYLEEGAFFGALLRVRFGAGLRHHLKSLLDRLHLAAEADGQPLRDAFVYIAVHHSYRLDLLTKNILARTLGYKKVGDLTRHVLKSLADESATATSGPYVFTRHLAIAQAIVEIVKADNLYDCDEIMQELLTAALSLYKDREPVDVKSWNYLSDRLYMDGHHDLGLRLAATALKLEPDNAFFVTQYAKLLRNEKQTELATRVFRTAEPALRRDRAFFAEWAACEGTAGQYALDAWLCAVSLADNQYPPQIDPQRLKTSLAGLAIAFQKLAHQYSNDVRFEQTAISAASLGRRIRNLDPGTAKRFSSVLQTTRSGDAEKITLAQFDANLREGVDRCYAFREEDIKIPSIEHPLEFKALRGALEHYCAL